MKQDFMEEHRSLVPASARGSRLLESPARGKRIVLETEVEDSRTSLCRLVRVLRDSGGVNYDLGIPAGWVANPSLWGKPF